MPVPVTHLELPSVKIIVVLNGLNVESNVDLPALESIIQEVEAELVKHEIPR